MRQVISMLFAMLLGILFPFGHKYTFLVQYLVMMMLFLSFLDINFHSKILTPLHVKVLIANLIIPLALFGLLYPFGYLFAISAFIVAIAPTAAGAPVLMSFLKGDIALVTVSVIVTSPVVAIALPFILPILMGSVAKISVLDLILPILSLVFIPLITSQLIKRYWGGMHTQLLKFKNLVFYLFLANIFIACGKATDFILTDQTTRLVDLLIIAALTGGICLLQFQIGYLLGRESMPVEGSMALGRKNTMFSIWLALTFVSPVAALSPIFYILFQNLYNSWQIWQISVDSKTRA